MKIINYKEKKIFKILKVLKKSLVNNIIIFNGKNIFFIEKIIFCICESKKHIEYVYKNIYIKFKFFLKNKRKRKHYSNEWEILDLNNIVIHLMTDKIKNKYKLDYYYK